MNRGSSLDRYSAFDWWVIGDDPDKAFLIEANAIGSARRPPSTAVRMRYVISDS